MLKTGGEEDFLHYLKVFPPKIHNSYKEKSSNFRGATPSLAH